MANPSVPAQNQPTGSGTEILKRSWADGVTDTTTVLITGVDGHLYTVLSIFISNGSSSATSDFILRVRGDSGSNYPHVIRQQSIGPYGTFIVNDKIVLTNTDDLEIYTAAAGDLRVYCSYIDQDWS